ncbi:chromate transporter [Rhodovarius crocodyli]|uniref:Chromate transporter n=1 Tax=Rhodovarius crocodyli TaxID=1979269 RepID=A0A437MCY3_9PROT|nr:chromate transporter [Rhodovarius crocodyli]RVT95514.1 chromate transporter [Rhodovarius crocodyli]
MNELWALMTGLAPLSLMAVGGGTTVLADMHRLIVEQHGWMDDAAFARRYALAQAAPGPNILVVGLFGWHVAGPLGVIGATLAMCGPAFLLALGFAAMRRRLEGARWLRVAERGLVPMAIGLAAASALHLGGAAVAAWGPQPIVGAAIMVVTAAVVFFTKRSPLWMLAGGAVLGVLLIG